MCTRASAFGAQQPDSASVDPELLKSLMSWAWRLLGEEESVTSLIRLVLYYHNCAEHCTA